MLLCESGQSFCAETFILLKTHFFAGTQSFQKNRPVLTHLPNNFKTGQGSRFPSNPAWLLIAPSVLSTLSWTSSLLVVGPLCGPTVPYSYQCQAYLWSSRFWGSQTPWPVCGATADLEVSELRFSYTQRFQQKYLNNLQWFVFSFPYPPLKPPLFTLIYFFGSFKTAKFYLERSPWKPALVMVCTRLTWPKKWSEKNVWERGLANQKGNFLVSENR